MNVSVVISNFNYAPFLSDATESVGRQTSGDVETSMVANGWAGSFSGCPQSVQRSYPAPELDDQAIAIFKTSLRH